jgi:hypothetical protein
LNCYQINTKSTKLKAIGSSLSLLTVPGLPGEREDAEGRWERINGGYVKATIQFKTASKWYY